MSSKTRTIEVDEDTAHALKARADERGMTVAQLLADIAAESGPVTVGPEEIAELDRRWAAIEAGEPTCRTRRSCAGLRPGALRLSGRGVTDENRMVGCALADSIVLPSSFQDRHPGLSAIVAREIIAKARILADSPLLGRAIADRYEYRQVVLRVLNAAYVFRYRVLEDRIIMLRVFHGRERRE